MKDNTLNGAKTLVVKRVEMHLDDSVRQGSFQHPPAQKHTNQLHEQYHTPSLNLSIQSKTRKSGKQVLPASRSEFSACQPN